MSASPSQAPSVVNAPASSELPRAEPLTGPEIGKTPKTNPASAASDIPVATPFDGYYAFEDVDQAASPIGDWLINANVLPHGAEIRIELWLWISANGKIDRWELAPGTPADSVLERALAELAQSSVQPALRNNIAVPSFRRLEVFISRE